MAMNNSGASFSVATTVFVSLAICAVISYGVFYYFKQRISVIEQSQMEQARIMQSFIARSIMHQQHQQHPHPHPRQDGNQLFQEHLVHKEVTITESGLIEVSSDSESESSDSDSDSESESTTSESSSDCDNESGSGSGSGSGSEHRHETKRIQIQIQSLPDAEVTDVIVDDDDKPESSTKKIISLNKTALGDNESDDDDDDNDDGESESGSEHHPDPDQSLEPFELNIGYKTKPPASKIHLNYGNMSVSALRQLAKERGLGGDDGDLQKLKKKDIVQLLQ
jgi:hypothetical protein